MESDIKKLDKIFYCDYHKRVEEIKKSTNKLVHYTSASAGLKINTKAADENAKAAEKQAAAKAKAG